MKTSKHLKLKLYGIGEEDSNATFKQFRDDLMGEKPESNLQIIDKACEDLSREQSSIKAEQQAQAGALSDLNNTQSENAKEIQSIKQKQTEDESAIAGLGDQMKEIANATLPAGGKAGDVLAMDESSSGVAAGWRKLNADDVGAIPYENASFSPTDCNSLIANSPVHSTKYWVGLKDASNKPLETSSSGAVMVLPGNELEQIQFYVDLNDGRIYKRAVLSTDSGHSFDQWVNVSSAPGGSGEPGQDGFSPTVEVFPIAGGTKISITDASGVKTFNVMDGKDGADGRDGTDGKSGVYTGSTPPEDPDVNVWINTSGDADPIFPEAGTDGQVLVKDSSVPEGASWKAASPDSEKLGGHAFDFFAPSSLVEFVDEKPTANLDILQTLYYANVKRFGHMQVFDFSIVFKSGIAEKAGEVYLPVFTLSSKYINTLSEMQLVTGTGKNLLFIYSGHMLKVWAPSVEANSQRVIKTQFVVAG